MDVKWPSGGPRVGLVGAGVMGGGIAQLMAAAGLEVLLLDTDASAAVAARERAAARFTRAVEKGRMTASAAGAAAGRLRVVAALGDLAGCGLVVEAIAEQLEAKRALFETLEPIVGDDGVLATNTSALSVTEIAAACRLPERVAGLHFFNPAPLMKVVEVVRGVRTSPHVVDALVDLVARVGHRPFAVRDLPGFLVNHAGRGYILEALRILGEGVASAADIDRVLRDAAGFPMGPFELLDLTGLDVSHPVMESIYRQFYEEPRFQPTAETARRLAAGLVGRKSSEGFYRYVEGTAIVPAEVEPPPDRPSAVWVGRRNPEAHAALVRLLTSFSGAADVEAAATPSAEALCLVAPLGEDATTAALAEGLDPHRTIAVDPLPGFDRRLTIMATPITDASRRRQAHGLLAASGRPVTLIADSAGFIVQRVLATVVNVGCEIAQRRIAAPADIDDAVTLGLGYPRGPLALGDALGPDLVMTILGRLHQASGEARYRPSPWLRRRAQLGVSLTTLDDPE